MQTNIDLHTHYFGVRYKIILFLQRYMRLVWTNGVLVSYLITIVISYVG